MLAITIGTSMPNDKPLDRCFAPRSRTGRRAHGGRSCATARPRPERSARCGDGPTIRRIRLLQRPGQGQAIGMRHTAAPCSRAIVSISATCNAPVCAAREPDQAKRRPRRPAQLSSLIAGTGACARAARGSRPRASATRTDRPDEQTGIARLDLDRIGTRGGQRLPDQPDQVDPVLGQFGSADAQLRPCQQQLHLAQQPAARGLDLAKTCPRLRR